jgi:hypothetical protein
MNKGFKLYFFDNNGNKILLSEFTSSTKQGFSLEETLSEEENDRYILNFKVPKNIGEGQNLPQEFNISNYLKISRKLQLELFSPNKTIDFIISSISPEGSNKNVIWNIEAQDYASFVFSKNNISVSLNTFEDLD